MPRKKTQVAEGDAPDAKGAPEADSQTETQEQPPTPQHVGTSHKPGVYRTLSGATLIRN